ncbi:unnamed protein product [Chondrus crispus]|uniref:Uncharacterized protein n=1 Tax=Chondrus crispus TaxID=2769 RepID=R7Q0S4_CHOCR|nr:unnamed protein product [Chondrus crispus]CDF32252.1 unnamed protein product [Chondrus crispus]|eukprot:XP_005711917.1 unnamed protein product [Chondrus crispus]
MRRPARTRRSSVSPKLCFCCAIICLRRFKHSPPLRSNQHTAGFPMLFDFDNASAATKCNNCVFPEEVTPTTSTRSPSLGLE